ERQADYALLSAVVINVAMLGFFKYADFVVGMINGLIGMDMPLPGISLPIGISFFTFQTMSYTIDVYRGEVKAQQNLATFTTFVCLFPQLIAGPIVRYADIGAELMERHSEIERIGEGLRRFVLGLAKKVLIANALGELTAVFIASPDKSVLFFWLYAVAFTLQIYFDFSGYSDMAIGLGRVFGFSFPENFNYPYLACSITEFWRRWHMTLGSWFRDYVYIPLGGNRQGTGKWLRNIFIVWLLTGLWHGAAWNFVLWGLLFGVVLTIEKLGLLRFLDKLPTWLRHIYVMFIILCSFVIFNGAGIGGACADLGGMFGVGDYPFLSGQTVYYLKSYGLLLILAIIGATPAPRRWAEKLAACPGGQQGQAVVQPLLLLALLLAVTAYLVDGSFNPFLYFRF
ncbi:MAG: MBOAT family O-acyltransferase, partial [Clostridiales bacterium]